MTHYYESIKGWFNFPKTYSEMVERFPNGSRFVEIGCWLGKSSVYMGVEIINSGKDIKFDCIDSWNFAPGEIDPDFVAPEDVMIDKVYDEFLMNVTPLSSVLTSYRVNSIDGSKLYKDNSLEFVYIDASHTYNNVMDDLECWFPKVKDGGFIGGHDYVVGNGVHRAVNGFFNNKKIDRREDNTWLYYKKY